MAVSVVRCSFFYSRRLLFSERGYHVQYLFCFPPPVFLFRSQSFLTMKLRSAVTADSCLSASCLWHWSRCYRGVALQSVVHQRHISGTVQGALLGISEVTKLTHSSINRHKVIRFLKALDNLCNTLNWALTTWHEVNTMRNIHFNDILQGKCEL